MIWHTLRILYTWTRWYKVVQSSMYCHAIYHGLPWYGVWRYVLPCTGSMTDSWLCILWTVRIKYVLVCTSLYLYILKKIMSIRVHIGTFWYVLVCTWLWHAKTGFRGSHRDEAMFQRLTWKRTLGTRNKSSAQWRLVGVGMWIERDSNEVCFCTSTYQYVPVCTVFPWTLHVWKFDIIIWYPLHRSCAWLFLTLKTLPGCVTKPHVLSKVRTRTYQGRLHFFLK